MAQRLTDRSVKGLPLPVRGNRIFYDDVVSGFGCRVTAAGARAFVLNYRRRGDGLERRYTIGAWPDWSVAGARDEAKRLKRDVSGGVDPLGDLRSERAAATMRDLCDRFIEDYLPRKRPSTQKSYRQQITAEIIPILGRLKAANVTFADVDGLHRKISQRAPYRANRTLALLSRMFTMAIKWQMRTDNPCKGVERNQEVKRKRYLSGDELARLVAALGKLKDRQSADIIRLLVLTGARRGEVLQARWRDFDLESGMWSKPGATTKQKSEHQVPLSGAARQLLLDIRQRTAEPADWAFPAADGSHRRDVKDAWARLCHEANITGARLHDLRHTYASLLVSAGLSLPIVGALLGHTQPSTTQRYAHLTHDPLRAATERVGELVMRAKKPAQVVPIRGLR